MVCAPCQRQAIMVSFLLWMYLQRVIDTTATLGRIIAGFQPHIHKIIPATTPQQGCSPMSRKKCVLPLLPCYLTHSVSEGLEQEGCSDAVHQYLKYRSNCKWVHHLWSNCHAQGQGLVRQAQRGSQRWWRDLGSARQLQHTCPAVLMWSQSPGSQLGVSGVTPRRAVKFLSNLLLFKQAIYRIKWK